MKTLSKCMSFFAVIAFVLGAATSVSAKEVKIKDNMFKFGKVKYWRAKAENIELPHLYFSHERDCFVRDGVIMGVCDFIELLPGEKIEKMVVRFRTIGDATCTGACLSTADNIDDIIDEVAAARQTERGTRADDKRSETSMEDRKKQGYF